MGPGGPLLGVTKGGLDFLAYGSFNPDRRQLSGFHGISVAHLLCVLAGASTHGGFAARSSVRRSPFHRTTRRGARSSSSQRKEPAAAAGPTLGKRHQADLQPGSQLRHECQQCVGQLTTVLLLRVLGPRTTGFPWPDGLESTLSRQFSTIHIAVGRAQLCVSARFSAMRGAQTLQSQRP